MTIAILGVLAVLAYGFSQNRPQDVPWTPLDLAQPIGMFTGSKLAALDGDVAQCRSLLSAAGVDYQAQTPRGGGQCRVDDAIKPLSSGAMTIGYTPDTVAPSCPVVAALAIWEWQVAMPAARQYLNSDIVRIRHFGSYSCRRINGQSEGAYSEHATANAIDIAGFDLADGRRISVLGDWQGGEEERQFLRAVRDGACAVFSTVLSPDYNAAHADHFHFDQANRGSLGWRACR